MFVGIASAAYFLVFAMDITFLLNKHLAVFTIREQGA